MSTEYSTDDECSNDGSEYCEESSCIFGMSEKCAECEATAELDEEINEVRQTLKFLYRKKKSFLQKMNSVHDPIVSRLPVEVVSHIFTFLVPETVHQSYGPVLTLDEDEKLRMTPLLLGTVCRAWRSIAWSTTQLWTSMSLNIYNYRDGLEEIVHEWLGRSGKRPLYIRLYAFRGSESSYYHFLVGNDVHANSEKLINAINAFSDRWFYLDLNISTRLMQLVHAKPDSELGMLNTLKLQKVATRRVFDNDDTLKDGDRIDFGKILNLRNLCAMGPNFHQITCKEWTNLTSLEASSLSVKHFVGLVYFAPLITHFVVHNLREENITFKDDLTIHRDKLVSLELNCYWLPSEIAALLSFPSLSHLSAEIHHRNGSDTESIQALLERSSCTLKSMRLKLRSMSIENGTDPEPAVELVKAAIPPSVETLELVCPYVEPFSIDFILQRRSRSQLEPEPLQRSVCTDILFPNLKDLRIRATQEHWFGTFDISCRPDDSPFNNLKAKDELPFSRLSPQMIPPQATLEIQHYHFSHLLDFAVLKQLMPVFVSNFSASLPKHVDAAPSFLSFLEMSVFQYKFEETVPKKERYGW
ncbi:hypothetical protein BDN70DRAFT_922875 [Pholiota conissans]|uniref:F-box domain-containing protein n=1 Tax=Pholiota conissans TaxID=109636 RepID=A0A9P5YWF4_9AGAR|nr:hypothetical protein BDN70DRAFT_922875 [Pholiota conissans]